MDPSLVGLVGLVTTTIPAAGMGQVRLADPRGGSQTYGAYGSPGDEPIRAGTKVTVVDHFPPRTLVVAVNPTEVRS